MEPDILQRRRNLCTGKLASMTLTSMEQANTLSAVLEAIGVFTPDVESIIARIPRPRDRNR